MKIIVTQTEKIVRQYLLEVPDDFDEDMVQEAFFEQDLASGPHFNERYNVDLDIDMEPGDDVPEDDYIIEVEE